jgi:hypothetical protein
MLARYCQGLIYSKTKIQLLSVQTQLRLRRKGRLLTVQVFQRRNNASKKWRERAMTINFKKTRLTFVESKKERPVPYRTYKKYALDAQSNVRT